MSVSSEEVDHWYETAINKEKVTFGWIISNVDQFLISGKTLRSERFRSSKIISHEWHLNLKMSEDNYISLWAVNTGEEDFGHISAIESFILNSKNQKVYSKRTAYVRESIETYGEYGCRNFISRSDLETLSQMYMPNNTLKLFVEMELSLYVVKNHSFIKNDPGLHEVSSFIDLFENPLFSDVTISIPQCYEFPAHKAILSAKSPTFFEIFISQPEMEVFETNEWGVFEMTRLAEWIYTGNLNFKEDFSNEDLMAVAHGFKVWDLKLIIEKNLSTTVCMENAAELLVFAEKHEAPILKTRAMHFITKNIKNLIEKKEFLEIIVSNPQLMSELFRNSIL
ncbi:speckle-type POZ protein-like [Belonocnema kinseyi]|uniref:speckle-type POZ protein-like n=1 Tax=Belonocnema kinseyi TaxID=2817044 RepID=UPI00143D3E26|nr:speckle-type POZ protein-like [Belonocnema kinseyi]